MLLLPPTMMTTTTQFLILSLLISCHILTSTLAEDTGFVGTLDLKELGLHKKDKIISHFRFYFHEWFTGSNGSSVPVVPSLPRYNSTGNFGLVGITDNALRVGPDPGSKVVGRFEGLYAGTSKSEYNLAVLYNFALTEGKYNGSTITVVGRNRLSLRVREMPVVGGSGVFKFATGYVETSTLYRDADRATIEYNIYVSHYRSLGRKCVLQNCYVPLLQ